MAVKMEKAPIKSLPPTNQHPVFTGWMPFLSPNQQCQSTEGKTLLPICGCHTAWSWTPSTTSKTHVNNVNEFKWQLTEVWTGLLLQNTVGMAAGDRRKQLRHFNVDMWRGRHFQHLPQNYRQLSLVLWHFWLLTLFRRIDAFTYVLLTKWVV